MTIQDDIRKQLNVKSEINPMEEIHERIQFLKGYVKHTGANGLILGISGGQDSTLAGRLAQLAVEQLREEGHKAKFIAVRLPHGQQHDEEDAQLSLQFIRPDETQTFNIQPSVSAFAAQYEDCAGEKLSDYHKGNVKARTRMMAQYAIGGMHGLLVVGTDHAAEAVTGFFTKFGDGGADVLPLSGLTKRQGRQVLMELGAIERLYLKIPTADLLDDRPQQADETELGISYDALDDYLEGKPVSAEVAKKIETQYKKTEHKRQLPITIFDQWWK